MTSFSAVIENLPGTGEKYEQTEDGWILKEFDLPEGMVWPHYYGFIQGTLSLDGDPLDVFVVTTRQFLRGEVVQVTILDELVFVDRGEDDPKVVARPNGEPDLDATALATALDSISAFLKLFKEAKGHDYRMDGFSGREHAERLVVDSQLRYQGE